MKLLAKSRIRFRRFLVPAFTFVLGASIVAPAQRPKLPRPRILEHEIRISRDPATGEMRPIPAGESASAPSGLAPVIRSRVDLVEAQCTVTAPDGTRVRGLTQDDFRLWEDGTEQKVSAFDAATTPASIALVIAACSRPRSPRRGSRRWPTLPNPSSIRRPISPLSGFLADAPAAKPSFF